jgi:hypothetical protein
MTMISFLPTQILAVALIARISFLRYSLYALAVLLILAAGMALIAWLVRAVWKIRWGARPTVRFVHLRNAGNVPMTLRVWMTSPEVKMQVRYLIDGATLPVEHEAQPNHSAARQPVRRQSRQTTQAAPAVKNTSAATPQKGAIPSAKDAKAKGAKAGKSVAKAGKGLAFAAWLGMLLATILQTLGTLIPGPIGKSAIQTAASLKRNIAITQARINKPVQKLKQAKQLQKQVGDLKKVAPAKDAAGAVKAAPAGTTAGQSAYATSNDDTDEQDEDVEEDTEETVEPPAPILPDYVQLPIIQPDERLKLEMRITLPSPFQGGQYHCWLLALDNEETGDLGKTVQRLDFRPASRFFWLLALVFSSAVVVASAVWVIWALDWLMYWWKLGV